MTIQEAVHQQLEVLSEEDRKKVLAFARSLKPSAPRARLFRGMFADRGIHVSLDELQAARHEAWAAYPREFPEGSGS